MTSLKRERSKSGSKSGGDKEDVNSFPFASC